MLTLYSRKVRVNMDNEQKVVDITESQNAPVQTEKKKMRGRGGKANFPNSRAGLITTDEDRRLVSKLLDELLVEYRKERVTSDEELAKRIDEYFTHCSLTGQLPTIEELCVSTGYTYATVYDWETGRRQGFSAETANIIKNAKEFIKAFDAKLVTSGKLNFLAYCFRGKQYYGFVDKQEITVNANAQNEQNMDAGDIAKRYIEDGRTVETTFADGTES